MSLNLNKLAADELAKKLGCNWQSFELGAKSFILFVPDIKIQSSNQESRNRSNAASNSKLLDNFSQGLQFRFCLRK